MKKGIFTVRSAYQMAKEFSLADKGECSNEGIKERMWKALWKINCPRVVHLFLWKACNNILPTKANLSKRGVTQDDKCPICNLELETIGHSLWSCQAAKDVWLECPARIQKCPCDEEDFLNIFMRLVERLTDEELRLVVTVARQIWFLRNNVIFKREFKAPGELFQAAHTQMEQHDRAMEKRNKAEPIEGQTSTRTVVRWKSPPIGVLKINWDAALDPKTSKMGMGILARDHEGRVLAMSSSIQNQISHPTTAETLAAWKAVVLGVQLGATYLELEGDALEVVQALNSSELCWGRNDPVLNDIKLLLQNFNDWKVFHVHRGANEAAHSLAKLEH
jgi:ribonuclease HI